MGNYLQNGIIDIWCGSIHILSGTIDIKMRILPLKLRKMHILKNFIKNCHL